MAKYKRKRRRASSKAGSGNSGARWLLAALVALLLAVILWPSGSGPTVSPGETGCKAAAENYGKEIKRLAGKYGLSPEYLMSVIMLECSGRRNVPPRFESSVFRKLKEVKEGKRTLENITRDELKDAGDDALRNLASSWGPFQIMGYKCFHLKIQIKDLRGSESLEHGVRWIDLTYGSYIRAGKYADAFHIHNTGRPVPKNGKYQTFDSKYVPQGLAYMEYFRKHLD